MRPKFRRAVFIVIYLKDKNKILYLILKRKLHWKGWEFPKGGIEPDESLISAVKREIKEETGQIPFNIKKYNFSGRYKYPKLLKDRPNIIGQSYTLFSAELKNKKIKLDKLEHSSYKWVSFSNALKLLTFKDKIKCLKIVNKQLI
jgi:8-oxo-dGTP pyrophosphatase MutT (NUDIX family)